MFYRVGNRIVEVGKRFPERRVNSLTFQTDGIWFPQSFYGVDSTNGVSEFYFESDTPNSLTVGYGDGNFLNYTFGLVSGVYRLGWRSDNTPSTNIPSNCLALRHDYTDGKSGNREISFFFENLKNVKEVSSSFVIFTGETPANLSEIDNLKSLKFRFSRDFNSFRDKIPKNLEILNLQNAFTLKLNKIPDSLFNTSIKTLDISGNFNLSNTKTSNFFKINQISETLLDFRFNNCDVYTLPDSFSNLVNTTLVSFTNNFCESFPKQLESLISLRTLAIGGLQSRNYELIGNNSWIDFTNTKEIKNLIIEYSNLPFDNLVNVLAPLEKLSAIGQTSNSFNLFIRTNNRYDEFINGMYDLSTTRAYLPSETIPSSEENPDKFRNFAFGTASRSYSGVYQQPSGFIQDEANGNPTTPAEKAFVLVNNYGYTITSGN